MDELIVIYGRDGLPLVAVHYVPERTQLTPKNPPAIVPGQISYWLAVMFRGFSWSRRSVKRFGHRVFIALSYLTEWRERCKYFGSINIVPVTKLPTAFMRTELRLRLMGDLDDRDAFTVHANMFSEGVNNIQEMPITSFLSALREACTGIYESGRGLPSPHVSTPEVYFISTDPDYRDYVEETFSDFLCREAEKWTTFEGRELVFYEHGQWFARFVPDEATSAAMDGVEEITWSVVDSNGGDDTWGQDEHGRGLSFEEFG